MSVAMQPMPDYASAAAAMQYGYRQQPDYVALQQLAVYAQMQQLLQRQQAQLQLQALAVANQARQQAYATITPTGSPSAAMRATIAPAGAPTGDAVLRPLQPAPRQVRTRGKRGGRNKRTYNRNASQESGSDVSQGETRVDPTDGKLRTRDEFLMRHAVGANFGRGEELWEDAGMPELLQDADPDTPLEAAPASAGMGEAETPRRVRFADSPDTRPYELDSDEEVPVVSQGTPRSVLKSVSMLGR